MYNLTFEKKALHDFNKFDQHLKERIWNKLQEAKQDPFRFFEKLVEIEGFKLRIGDWRVIADIIRETQTINILKIEHRRKVYKD